MRIWSAPVWSAPIWSAVLALALVATVVGTGLTLYALRRLGAPR